MANTANAALFDILPSPCALVDESGILRNVNPAWCDIFFQTALDTPLLSAAATLFHWDEAAWALVEQDLRALLAGELDRYSFEAHLAEPPERWCQCALAALPGGGLVWQLHEITSWRLTEEETTLMLRQIRDGLDNISDGFALFDADDRMVFCNARYRAIYAESADLLVPGRTFAEIARLAALRGQYPDAVGRVDEWLAELLSRRANLEVTELQLHNGTWLRSVDRRTNAGGIVGIRSDITELKHAEELRQQGETQAEVIRAQDALLAELSTPLLRISERAILMPLVGSVDSHRAERVVLSLLTAIEEQRVNLVILDITGVPVVDTQVAHALLSCARAVRLLGARMILTGIKPDVAQTVITLGVDLSDILTLSDLQMGVRYALGRK